MLDFARLKTPPDHGDVLVAPDPQRMASLVTDNAERLRTGRTEMLGEPISEWRRRTRMRITGFDDRPIIVVGHQPEFFHAGVWAKHIVADRLARARGGIAINLVVDNDAPKNASLRIPTGECEEVAIRVVPFPKPPAGQTHEAVSLAPKHEIEQLRAAVREVLGRRFQATPMPDFFSGLSDANDARDWVDQLLAGRRCVEQSFGLELRDVRVSQAWWSPLLAELMMNAPRFAETYNRALAWYRGAFRVRGANRPIPDLSVHGLEVELPFWAYRAHEPRRRLYAATGGGQCVLSAGGEHVATVGLDELPSHDDPAATFAERGGWRIRPRALTLTLWARVFLADLFIHGIGGAKYDRITDRIIADYFALEPPDFGCISATLHLFPPNVADDDSPADLHRQIRELSWNPQRILPDNPFLAPLLARRAAAVQQSLELRSRDPGNHAVRREAFRRIRAINDELRTLEPSSMVETQIRLDAALRRRERDRIAHDREYFFALHDRTALESLLSALPDANRFLV